jgi:hypothetical protein
MHITINDVKVYIVSPGSAHYKARLLTVFERLVTAGFKRVEFFRSLPSTSSALDKETGVTSHIGTDSLSRTILAILERELVGGMRRPFIIVEDDVQVFHACESIDLPENADAVYLGVSKWIYPHKYETLGRGFHIQENGPEHVKDASPILTRILGMTGGHAILFINPEYVRRFIAALTPRLPFSTPHDLVFATLQPEFNVFALKKPLFYQDSALGGQEAVTRLVYDGVRYITAD